MLFTSSYVVVIAITIIENKKKLLRIIIIDGTGYFIAWRPYNLGINNSVNHVR